MGFFLLGGTRGTARTALPIKRAVRAAVEALEGRQLLSVSVPSGYVSIGSVDVTATSSAGADTPALAAGHDYFFVADGQHQLSPLRHADAASYETSIGVWQDGTHLHVGGVDWGAHASDNEYGAAYTATADGAIHAYISDGKYSDNSGSLTLTVYEKVTLDSLTVTSQQYSDETATATDATPQTIDVSLKDDGSDLANLVQTLTISGSVSPNTSNAFAQVLYEVYADQAGAAIAGGTLPAAGAAVDLDVQNFGYDYTVNAGVDANSNGILDSGEITRTVAAQGQKLTVQVTAPPPQYNAATKTLTLSATGGAVDLTFVAYSGKNHVPRPSISFSPALTVAQTSVVRNANGDNVVTFTPTKPGTENFPITDLTDPFNPVVIDTLVINVTP